MFGYGNMFVVILNLKIDYFVVVVFFFLERKFNGENKSRRIGDEFRTIGFDLSKCSFNVSNDYSLM
jgi:hypothetical protein